MSITRPFFASTVTLLVGALLVPASVMGQSPSIFELLPTDGRRLEIGAEHRGALSSSDHLSSNDNFLEAWELDGEAGQSVTVDLESDDFDPLLYIVGPGLAETLRDDDGGGGCDSRLSFTFLENGSFRVVASSLGTRETGTYTLRVSDGPSPAPTYACGEADPAALAALPTEGRTLSMGAREAGQMLRLASTIEDGRPAQAWLLEGNAGDRISVVMEADAFDAFLYLMGPGLDGIRTDDDGAGELNARIDVTLPADGPYTVVASSITSGASGAYLIRVEEPLDLATIPTDGRSMDLGQTTEGYLTSADPIVVDGRQGQAWALDGEAGQLVTVELISDDFDAYLYLAGPGLMEPMSDDDGGGDLNSRITLTLPESGSYRIIVSALSSGSSGAFTLRVSPQYR